MRIAYIATGAAGMVCGTCIHDNTLAAALIKLGHEVALIPTYTPIRTDERNVSLDHVFLGGINVYLQEKFSLFRHTPDFIDNLFNNKRLLGWVSKFSASTNAAELGRMTVSVLKGEHGHQRKELMKLVDWLKNEYKPDIVQLNHSLIVGFAHEIKRQLGVPVICGVQGEDLFLDELIEPYKTQAMKLLHQKINEVDAIIATSDFYANYMTEYLGAQPEKLRTVYLGINLQGHGELNERSEEDRITIGYFARLCPEKGLHLIIQAFHQLWQRHEGKIHLMLAGYLSPKDQPFVEKWLAKIHEWGMQDAVDYLGEVDRIAKIDLLRRFDIFSVPTVYKESKGLSVLEAMANSAPAVLPDHGLFPELIAKTKGGLLVKPDSVDALAAGLQKLIQNKELRLELSANAKHAVHKNFSDKKMAEGILAVYNECLGRSALRQPAAISTSD